MTNFEEFLIEKGYVKYVYNSKDKRYYKPKAHIISTMENICHIYIKDNKEEEKIVFGLSEKDKPPTLIYPRPRIRVKKLINFNNELIQITQNEQEDNSMNIVLSKINFEETFKAMYDKSICFEFDLTKN